MDEVTELLDWLVANKLITVEEVRTWEAKAYLCANNGGIKRPVTRDALKALVTWYNDNK